MRSLCVLMIVCFLSLNLFGQFDIYEGVKWVNKKAINYEHDDSGKIGVKEFELWNHNLLKWEKTKKRVNGYNQEGIRIVRDVFEYNNGEYSPLSKRNSSSIDLNPSSISIESEVWNSRRNKKRLAQRRHISYLTDQREKDVETIISNWNVRNEEWRNKSKKVKSYTQDGKLEEKLEQLWDRKTEGWRNWLLKEIYYFDNGIEKETINKKWNKKEGKWTYNGKEIRILNDVKTSVWKQIRSQWNDVKNDWEETQISIITEIEKNKEFQVTQRRENENSSWKNSSRTFYFYDIKGEILEIVFQKWDVSSLDFYTTSRILYERNIDGVLEREVYQNATLQKEISQKAVEVSLITCDLINPYTLGSPINCSSFDVNKNYNAQLFDLNGQIVFEEYEIKNSSFSISKSLSSGSYFLVIRENGDLIYKRKIILQNY